MSVLAMRRLAALLILAASAGSTAWAASASATLGNIRFTVIDLDAHDGIAAGYSIVGSDAQSSVGIALANAGTPLSNKASRVSSAWLAPMAAAHSLPGASARGEITPRSIAASGTARGAGSHFISETLVQSAKDPSANIGLVLKPHTELLVSAEASVTAAGDKPCAQARCEMAAASAGLGTRRSKDDLVWLSASTVGAGGSPYAQTRTKTLQLTIRNASGQPLRIGLWLHAQVWGDGGGAPPPPAQSPVER